MTSIQKELECLLMPKHSSPSKRGIASGARVGVSHVYALDKALYEEQVVLWTVTCERSSRSAGVDLEAYL